LSSTDAKENPFRPLFVPDAAERSVAFLVGPLGRGMERAVAQRPGKAAIADQNWPIGEPGGGKLSRQLVGRTVP
jgi:hypothetical protein